MEFLKDLKKQLAQKGINIINTDYYNYIDMWGQWYKGNVDDFHHYNIKLADGTTAQAERLTMNMPKKLCEDFSKLLWSEKAKIHTDNDANDKKLWEILDSKKNLKIFGIFLEKAFLLDFLTEVPSFVVKSCYDKLKDIP